MHCFYVRVSPFFLLILLFIGLILLYDWLWSSCTLALLMRFFLFTTVFLSVVRYSIGMEVFPFPLFFVNLVPIYVELESNHTCSVTPS